MTQITLFKRLIRWWLKKTIQKWNELKVKTQTKSRNGSRVIDTQPIIKYPKFGDHYLSLLTSPQICWTVLWTWNMWSWLGWWLVGGQRIEKSIELNWSCCQLVGDLQRWRGLLGQVSLDIQQVGGFCSRRREVSRERSGLKISGGLDWEPAHSHLWCAVSAKARQTALQIPGEGNPASAY